MIFEDKANSIIRNMIVATMEKINVQSGECRYNQRCHLNAVHDAVKNHWNKIAMIFCIDQHGIPFIHFVNIDNDGNYIDNTLGYWITKKDCYYIREISKESFDDIQEIFKAYRIELQSKFPFYMRLFGFYEF